MATMKIYVTIGAVAVKREGVEGYDIQSPYTIGKYKLREFQKLVNHYYKDTKVLSTNSKELHVEVSDTSVSIQQAIEEQFTKEHTEVACYIEPIEETKEV